MTAKYFTTADGRIVRGEVVSLPVLAVNYEVGVGFAMYLGETSSLREAEYMAVRADLSPLTYDHRPSPPVRVRATSHSIVASNGKTYHEWIEVPVALTEKVA